MGRSVKATAAGSLERLGQRVQQLRPPSPGAMIRNAQFPYRAPATPRTVEPLPAEKKTGANYDTDWARRYPARMARAALTETVLRGTIRLVADPDRHGLDRLAGLEGPLIFAANHHSHVDAGLLLSSIPEPWRHKVFTGAAADYFFTNRVTAALSALALNAIPIERTKVTRRSADQAAELIDNGWSMVIFPEGGRSPDGWGQPFRGGAAYLAIRCGVPVIPVHLRGTGAILAKGAKKLRPGRTEVTFGAPLRALPDEDSRRFAARLEVAVAALADEARTDWYSARVRAHADATPTLSGPESGDWRRIWSLGERDRKRRRQATSRPWPDLN